MHVDEYVQELDRLKPVLRRNKDRQVFSQELRHRIRAVAETWPNDVRLQVVGNILGDERVGIADDAARKIIEATFHNTTANKYLDQVAALRKAVIGLHVRSTVTGQNAVEKPSADTLAVERGLEALNPAIADSYRQVLLDLRDNERISLRGTANELREVLREVLEVRSPDEMVMKESWYQTKDAQGREKHRPTYADRAKYAVRLQSKGKNIQKQTPGSVERADELLGSIVRSTYDRGSGAAHTETERSEIIKQLRYVNAVLLELLPARTP